MKNKIFSFIMDHRIFVLILLLVTTLFFGWFATQARFNNTLESYFFKDDLKDYDRFLDQFGTDEIIAIAFGGEEVFTIDNLRLINTITGKLEQLPHVRRVISLTTAKLVYGDDENVYFDPLIKDIPSSPQELIHIKQRALADPFIPNILVSTDTRSTAIVAEIDHIIGEFDYKIELINQIRNIIGEQERKTGKHFRIGGTSILDEAFFRYNQRDQALFMPLMLLLIISIVYLMFRRFKLLVLPVFVVLLTMIWTYGLLVLLGYEINVITSIIPPLLMAVAIADSMHFIADYLHEAASGTLTKIEAIKRAFENVVTPCLMTSVTTALGLLSLLSADLTIIRQFGVVSAGGVLFAFITSVILLPILLSLMPYPQIKYQEQFRTGFFAKMLQWLGTWQKGRSIAIIATVMIAIIPAVFLLAHLNIGTNSLDYFKKDDVVRTQVEWIDTNIGGTTSLEFFIDTEEDETLKNPAFLRKMEQFQSYLESIDGITGVYSAVDLLKSLNRGFHEGNQEMFVIPATLEEVAQQLFLVEGSEDIEALLSDDYSKARIMARVEMNKSQQVAHHIPEITKRMREIFTGSEMIFPTGIIYLMNQTEHYLLTTSIKSFLLAFVVITITIMIMLQSVKLGVLAMIPNILPILFTMALMPLLGISLDVGTSMIAAIALGLVVDDTIHFLSRLMTETKQTHSTKKAMANAIKSTGRPIVYTSIVLSFGFMTLVLASFTPLVNFGLLSGIVILFALFFDLIVLPAIIGFVGVKSKKV
jgi:predicted RND superfamily exporter protein